MGLRACALLCLLGFATGCGDSKSRSEAVGGTPGGGTGGNAVSGGSAGKAAAAGAGQNATGGGSGGLGSSDAGGSGGKALDPSVMTEEPTSIDELAVSATRIYWLEGHNRILSMPLEGGVPSVLYASTTPGAYEALHIALGADRLYFTDQGSRQPVKPRGVFSVPLDGTEERTTLLMTTTVDQLTVDGGYVYFTANDCIARISTSGGAATALVRNINTDTPLVVHAGYVYFWYAPSAAVMQNVFRVPVTEDAGPLDANGSGGSGGSSGSTGGTGGASPIAAEQISNTTRYSELILAPKVDGGYVYWSIYDELYRWPITGGTQDKFGALRSGSITLLLVDRGDIYWGGGNLQRFVVGGDSNTLVTSSLQDLSALAVNETHIFIADGKLLRRVERP